MSFIYIYIYIYIYILLTIIKKLNRSYEIELNTSCIFLESSLIQNHVKFKY